MAHDLRSYTRVGHRLVRGWAQPEVFRVLELIDSIQRAEGITGGAAEIGVHHGQLFIALDLLLRDGEKSVAIDLFDDQDRNVDRSGKGDRDRFMRNVERHSDTRNVVVHKGDSTELTAEQLLELAGGPIRMFSVDGGHTEGIVLSDMTLAENTLVDGGVVIADDVFNAAWPEVVVGTLEYLRRPTALHPFAIGYNKVFFAHADRCSTLRAALTDRYENRPLYHFRTSTFGGHPVVLFADVARTPRELLAQNPLARKIYQRIGA